jgi:hypothetical protein
MARQPLVGLGLIVEAPRSYSDTPHSAGLLWTSYQPDSGISNRQHTTLTTDNPVPGGIRTRNPNKRAVVDPRLRPRRHRGRISYYYIYKIFCKKNSRRYLMIRHTHSIQNFNPLALEMDI